jgi:hypothetical protein
MLNPKVQNDFFLQLIPFFLQFSHLFNEKKVEKALFSEECKVKERNMADIESGWDRVGSLKKKVLIKYRRKKDLGSTIESKKK